MGRVFLAHFVVAPAQDDIIIFFVTFSEPKVFVFLCRIIEQAVLYRALWNTNGNAVSTIVFHLSND